MNINIQKVNNISNLSDELLNKLGKSKTQSYIRFFFKGRPLKNEEKIKDLGNNKIKFRKQYIYIL